MDKSYLRFLMDSLAQERLSNLIKELRGERSQRNFAKSLGVSYASVRTWEEGESMPSVKNLKKIAKYSNQSVEELLNHLSGEGENKSSINKVPSLKIAEEVIPYIKDLPKKESAKLAKFLIEKISN